MLHSMTGYGNASTETGFKKLTMEIRALNGKQFDVNFRAPITYKSQEMNLRKLVSKNLFRGKIDLFLTVDIVGDAPVQFNEHFIRTHALALKEISSELDLPNTEILRITMTLPNALLSETKITDDEKTVLEDLCKKAIDKLITYRKNEGRSLENDFKKQTNAILTHLEAVKLLAPERIAQTKERMRSSLENLAQKKDIDQNRFEQELIYYLEKLDINEEIVRLSHNCAMFLNELNTETVSKGKKLNFIAQEMGREINTIGSKANNQQMQREVVEMKNELEKIKEQLGNVL